MCQLQFYGSVAWRRMCDHAWLVCVTYMYLGCGCAYGRGSKETQVDLLVALSVGAVASVAPTIVFSRVINTVANIVIPSEHALVRTGVGAMT